jgi:hypothetical protein
MMLVGFVHRNVAKTTRNRNAASGSMRNCSVVEDWMEPEQDQHFHLRETSMLFTFYLLQLSGARSSTIGRQEDVRSLAVTSSASIELQCHSNSCVFFAAEFKSLALYGDTIKFNLAVVRITST